MRTSGDLPDDGTPSAPSTPPPPHAPPGSSGGDGCGAAPGPNDTSWSVDHGGRERSFLVHVPAGYDPARPTPVVLEYHGRMIDAGTAAAISGLRALADREGFIAVHMQGIGNTWNGGFCCGEAQAAGVDDVGFTRAALDALEARLCVDRRRVFATGLSNGGFMAHRVACEMADRIAAIAPIAGTLQVLSCTPSRPVAVLAFHGTADNIVPYDGFFGQFSVRATMEGWRGRNACAAGPAVTYEQGDVRCEAWSGCRGDATVELCTIDGGGHQWPGGATIPLLGRNTANVSATEAMWRFFAAHPMP